MLRATGPPQHRSTILTRRVSSVRQTQSSRTVNAAFVMDTSDSEAFQSADEDFDDEVTVKFSGHKRSENEVKSKHVTDSCFQQARDPSRKTDGADRCANVEKRDDGVETIKPSQTEKPVPTDDLTKQIASVSLDDEGARNLPNEAKQSTESTTVTVDASTDAPKQAEPAPDTLFGSDRGRGECVEPPTITECWEYESWEDYKRHENEKKEARERENVEKSENKTERDPNADTKCNIEDSGKSENAEPNDWDNDFDDWGDDEEIETCDEPRAEKDNGVTDKRSSAAGNERKGSIGSERNVVERTEDRGYGIPPRRTVCWEMEKHDRNLDKKSERSDVKENVKTGDAAERKNVEDTDEKNDWDNDFGEWDAFERADGSENRATAKNTDSDVAPLFEKLSGTKSDGWGNWSGWGVSSLLSTATGSVQTFTSQVSQGLSTVLESSIGIVGPEELARLQKLEKENDGSAQDRPEPSRDDRPRSESGVFGLGNLMTGVGHITKLVETTGSKVVSTGLDTLEVIGKKTMEVLQDGDPGLVKKRALFGLDGDRPVLSQILREAKERAEIDTVAAEKPEARRVRYETLFDDNRGLVHLEALEMLSKQCEIKLESIVETTTGDALDDLRETLVQVKELCELPEDDDDEDEAKSNVDSLMPKLDEAVGELGVALSYEKFAACWKDAADEIEDMLDENAVHEKAIETLAKLTSAAVEQFHRAAELLLIKDRRSTADEADSLVRLTVTVSTLIGAIAARFSEKLDSLSTETNSSNLNSLITNVFLEATNSSSYVRDAFQLLVPILQAGAV